jgi:hypothetical protein
MNERWYRIGDFIPDPQSFGLGKGCDFLNGGCEKGDYPEFCTGTEVSSCLDGRMSAPSLIQVLEPVIRIHYQMTVH